MVELMETAISIRNRPVSAEVEDQVQDLIGNIVRVRHTSHHVEGITAFMRSLVGQFPLTDARRK
ncbi:hypothetical protein N6H14_24450 [Paenibacillus sp. CC-CFT747]|nr:hypothetical protein N6H14_24450 [Paenibacillus sp. CC-CFT747]